MGLARSSVTPVRLYVEVSVPKLAVSQALPSAASVPLVLAVRLFERTTWALAAGDAMQKNADAPSSTAKRPHEWNLLLSHVICFIGRSPCARDLRVPSLSRRSHCLMQY